MPEGRTSVKVSIAAIVAVAIITAAIIVPNTIQSQSVSSNFAAPGRVEGARVLEVQRDARIAAAQLAEARAKLALVQAGPREEDIREVEARCNIAAAELAAARARLDQCSVRAPVDGLVLAVQASPGQFFSA